MADSRDHLTPGVGDCRWYNTGLDPEDIEWLCDYHALGCPEVPFECKELPTRCEECLKHEQECPSKRCVSTHRKACNRHNNRFPILRAIYNCMCECHKKWEEPAE